jgi:general transcription factor IIIA
LIFEVSNFRAEEPNNDSDDEYKSEDNETFDRDSLPRDTPDTTISSRLTSSSPRKKFPSELKTLKCPYDGCLKSFNRQSRLETHKLVHENKRPFVCAEPGCGKDYHDKKHLTAHTKASHSNMRAHVCHWEGCGKKFLTSTRLKRHIKGHENKVEFRCTEPDCTRVFRKHVTLERHILSDHLNKVPYPCTFVDPTTGIQCSFGFDGATGLASHIARTHRPEQFFCPECPLAIPGPDGGVMYLGFVTETQLQAHIKKEHNHCSFCGRKCSNHIELQKHIESQHSGIPLDDRKKIPCTVEGCEKRFTKVYNRNVHVQTQHEGARFICGTFEITSVSNVPFNQDEGCGKGFTSKANLEDHIRTGHLGMRSVINANRKRTAAAHDGDEDEDAEFELDDDMNLPLKRARLAAGKQVKTSAIDDLTGHSYGYDPRRKIACLIPGCPHRSMRNYDMKQHLRSKHDLSDAEIEELEQEAVATIDEPEFQFPVGDTRNDEAYGEEGVEEDVDWGGAAGAPQADQLITEDLPYRGTMEEELHLDASDIMKAIEETFANAEFNEYLQ